MSRVLNSLVLFALLGCVGPIGAEQHQAALDRDRDGVVGAEDCDPNDPAVSPFAVEWCNGIDDDCDGVVDGPDARGVMPFWPDADADGYGDRQAAPTWACSAPEGHVANDADCLDDREQANPDAVEWCNGFDDDCDGAVDEDATDLREVYADDDGDGYGAGPALLVCATPTGFVDEDGDCDDTDPTVFPGQLETCDGVDEDCNGAVDDWVIFETYYADVDGDGFGGPAFPVQACVAPAGYTATFDDCDDGDPAVNPVATEVCNGIDDDCDGATDDADPGILPVDQPTWFADLDGDGAGDGASAVQACVAPPQHVGTGDDCDDSDPAFHPQAPELCDGMDNDCDGSADELDSESPDQRWFADLDGDGFGGATEVVGCSPPADHVAVPGDCDDGDVDVNPGATEVCGDGVDNDCDQAGCRLSGDLGEGDADRSVASTIGGSEHGAALGAGDWTDDGVVDLAIGGPGASRVVLYSGPLGPGGWSDGDERSLVSGAVGSRFGAALASGDLTGDGVVDLVVGAPADATGDTDGGAVWLLAGPVPAGAVDGPGTAAASVVGAAGDGLGAVLAVGGLGGGPAADLALGAPAAGTGGEVGVFLALTGPTDLASADVRLLGAAGDQAGTALTVGGDLDGDGLRELVVGSPGRASGAGAVDLVEPTPGTADLALASQRELTGDAGLRLGSAVARGGDLNGDGYPDLLVAGGGASAGHPGGAVFAVPGGWGASGPVDGASLAVLDRSVGPDAQWTLASGDLDDDGLIDLLLGDASGTGRAWLVYGPVAGSLALDTDAHATFLPGGAPARFGAAVRLDDVDGDGLDDAWLGSPLGGVPAEPGTVTIFLGEGF